VITQVVRGSEDPYPEGHILWIETLLISLAHYFTSRRFVDLPDEVRRQLEEDGTIDRERHPLFLPKHTIRIVIIGAFAWLTYYLYQQNRLSDQHALSLLGVVAAFLLGAFVRKISRWWNRHRTSRGMVGTWGDIKAVVVILALLLVAIPEFFGQAQIVNPSVQRVSLGLMLFYIGSR
jgi:hypothetical protein